MKDAVQSYKAGKPKSGSPPADSMGESMMPPTGPTFPTSSPEQEIEALGTRSQMLAQQLSEIQHRIEELQKKN